MNSQRAHVFWLLLQPDDAGQRRVAAQQLPKGGARKRVQLLHTTNGDVARLGPVGAARQVHVDLAAAQHEPCDRRGPLTRLCVVDHREKAAPCQIEGCGTHGRVPQQALRCQHEQRERIAREQMCLPPKQMEVLGRCRAIDEAKIDVGRRLKDALGPSGRVIRSLAFIGVRQQKHERGFQTPLRSTRRDELIQDNLRSVQEVAGTALPK